MQGCIARNPNYRWSWPKSGRGRMQQERCCGCNQHQSRSIRHNPIAGMNARHLVFFNLADYGCRIAVVIGHRIGLLATLASRRSPARRVPGQERVLNTATVFNTLVAPSARSVPADGVRAQVVDWFFYGRSRRRCLTWQLGLEDEDAGPADSDGNCRASMCAFKRVCELETRRPASGDGTVSSSVLNRVLKIWHFHRCLARAHRDERIQTQLTKLVQKRERLCRVELRGE